MSPTRARQATRSPRRSWRAITYQRADMLAADLLPVCPTCCDLHPAGTNTCPGCGLRLLVNT